WEATDSRTAPRSGRPVSSTGTWTADDGCRRQPGSGASTTTSDQPRSASSAHSRGPSSTPGPTTIASPRGLPLFSRESARATTRMSPSNSRSLRMPLRTSRLATTTTSITHRASVPDAPAARADRPPEPDIPPPVPPSGPLPPIARRCLAIQRSERPPQEGREFHPRKESLMSPRTILVAVDGSEHSNKAVEFAADLATHEDADLVLLHVVPDPSIYAVPTGLEEYTRLEKAHITQHDLMMSAA